MKICIVAEGCYPYVSGGVSSWLHTMIQLFPHVEFLLVAILADRSQRGKFVYELPENLTAVYEVYLQDKNWGRRRKRGRRFRLEKEQYASLRSVILNQEADWDPLLEMFRGQKRSVDDLVMGEDFLHIVTECYNLKYPQISFSDFLWTMRSIYLPLFLVLQLDIPEADLYHCSATGYAGVIGSMAKKYYGSALLVSEHGIYTREREEELIKAEWVSGLYKNIWIEQFKKMSLLAYQRADLVTSLYEQARELQIELGCPPEKTVVVSNGIELERYENLAGKTEEDEGWINIGALVRVTAIKDIKTMIQAFSYAKKAMPALRLWIMGSCEEEPQYVQECFEVVESLGLTDVIFTGLVDVRDYLGRMDMTILTSISEGQPLMILESYAAGKPVIATDVGNCRGLIYGENDDFGQAGILTHIMNIDEIAAAIETLAGNEALRKTMGENGYRRVRARYQLRDMKRTYADIYQSFAEMQQVSWPER